jgi:carbon monoxide dehydrogenase subunit G
MSDLSTFESRTGKLTCTPSEVFDFVTDIRNFKQFIPDGTINDLQIEKESCSFNISPLGNVKLNLSQKEAYSKVVFNGSVLQSNDFSMIMNIKGNAIGKAEVHIKLAARLNPVLKMMVAKPVVTFLERMINEMERFRGWKNIKS